MRRSIELSEDECKENVQNFYSYFEDYYKFEDFLKIYLYNHHINYLNVV